MNLSTNEFLAVSLQVNLYSYDGYIANFLKNSSCTFKGTLVITFCFNYQANDFNENWNLVIFY